jgi:integrase
VHVRRPRLDDESHAVGLDRNELGAILVAAGLAGPREHPLVSLLALNGLRISEALGAEIEDRGLVRGHRTLTVTRKGGKVVTIPLAPRATRALDLPSANAPTARSSWVATVPACSDTPPPASSPVPPEPAGSTST